VAPLRVAVHGSERSRVLPSGPGSARPAMRRLAHFCAAPRAERAALVLVLLTLGVAGARAESKPQPGIQDNSFLVEEAYNQEKGVVQHISSFARFREGREWAYTFTEEWPLSSWKHQISYSLALQDPADEAVGNTGLGDAVVNYRCQVLGGGEERAAFAPRASLFLPVGDERRGRGAGAPGLQIALPLSAKLSERLTAHSNAGVTFFPSARNERGDEADTRGVNLGQSVIYLARPGFNLMLEAVWSTDEEVVSPGKTSRSSNFLVSPGLRWAHNFPSALQIVPGIAVPIGLGVSRGENGILLYLSFEHSFGRPASNRE